MRQITFIAACSVFLSALVARADIYQWEYINPADPSQGKQQSTTLAPGGAGVDALPGAILAGRNLTMAYLIGADLTYANGQQTNLTNADLSQASLANANFSYAALTGADFTGTDVRGVNFNADRYVDDLGKIHLLGGITLAQLYSTANYQDHDLSGIGLRFNDLSGGNFAGQNLANAIFLAATLSNADFSGADVRGAVFSDGFKPAQLYSTASYQAHDLTGIVLQYIDLSGWNFTDQNLTNARFYSPTLAAADFTGAVVRGARFAPYYDINTSMYVGLTFAQLYSTASYQTHDLTGIHLANNDLSGWNFAGQNLKNANFFGFLTTLTGADFTEANLSNAVFEGARLTDANFTDAEVRGANFAVRYDCFDDGCFPSGGITLAQLYSTASYKAHDLSGINLILNNLAGGNFAGQNVANADFSRTECGTFGCYPNSAVLTDADFTAADARGSDLFTSVCNRGGCYLVGEGAIATNLIRYDGHIHGLDLEDTGLLVVRDHDGPIPIITVDQHLAMAPGGTLRMVFEADAWDSTISFAPGIPVTLGGTLELTFAADVNLATQLGRTLDLFDWTGVTPTGAFTISSPYAWDLSNLYTTGEITFTAIPEPTSPILLVLATTVLTRRRQRPAKNSC